jgi:hypothetical protein
MKKGAGIVGILFGIFAFLTFGMYFGGGGAIAEAAGEAGGEMDKYIGLGIPLLAIAGGAISFGQPQIGGLFMLLSAAGVFYKTDVDFFGLAIGAPIAVAGLVSLFSNPTETIRVRN